MIGNELSAKVTVVYSLKLFFLKNDISMSYLYLGMSKFALWGNVLIIAFSCEMAATTYYKLEALKEIHINVMWMRETSWEVPTTEIIGLSYLPCRNLWYKSSKKILRVIKEKIKQRIKRIKRIRYIISLRVYFSNKVWFVLFQKSWRANDLFSIKEDFIKQCYQAKIFSL